MSLQPFKARAGFNAEGNRVREVADAQADDDAINLRQLLNNSGVKFAGRISNLPSPSATDPKQRPIPGQPYLVKMDLAGKELNRLVVWDSNATTTGPIAEVDVIEPPADIPEIKLQAGRSDAGKPFTAGIGTGAILLLTAMADGNIKGDVTTPGDNYAIGDFFDYPAGSLAWGAAMTGNTRVVVTRLGGTAPALGGWRIIDTQTWLKSTAAAPDQPYSQEPGDLQITTEDKSEELKVWTGTAWHTIVANKDIEAKIASLSLFEGTAKQVGGTAVPGAVEITALPDLASTTPGAAAGLLGKTSHYWTWVGTAGYTVVGTDPNGIGRDLAGAIMQVGDWLQIANRGTPAAPDLRWVHIGGDLLAKSRADVLYGINSWVAGNYEKGSLVNYKGALYKATANVLAAQGAPDTAGVPWAVIPLTAGVHNVPSDADLPATAPASDVYLVLNSAIAGGKPGLFSFDPGTNKWIQLGGSGGRPLDLTGGSMMVGVGCPIGTIIMWGAATLPAGWVYCDGAAINATSHPELAALYPTGKVPDLRGQFIRGWGATGGAALGSQHQWTTGKPRTMFTGVTNNSGAHRHGNGAEEGTNNNCWKSGDCSGNRYMFGLGNSSEAGTHAHIVDINNGGDAETAPDHVIMAYLIKATEIGVRLRP